VQGLAVELSPGLRVNAIAPTWTDTPLWDAMGADQRESTRRHFEAVIPLRRTATIDELAMGYLFAMENGFLTGQTIAIDGGVALRG